MERIWRHAKCTHTAGNELVAVNAFGVRFSRQVEGQKDIAEEHIARQKEGLEAEAKRLKKETEGS